MEEQFERFCVQCGSTNLKLPTLTGSAGTGNFWQNVVHCVDCGVDGIAMDGTREYIQAYKKKLEHQ